MTGLRPRDATSLLGGAGYESIGGRLAGGSNCISSFSPPDVSGGFRYRPVVVGVCSTEPRDGGSEAKTGGNCCTLSPSESVDAGSASAILPTQ